MPRKFSSNCVPCILNPVVTFGFPLIAVLPPVCVHMKNGRPRNLLKFNNRNIAISISCTAILLARVVFCHQDLKLTEYFLHRTYMKDLAQEVLTTNAIILAVNFYFFNRTYRIYTNSLITMVEKRKLFGVDTLLSKHATKRLVKILRTVLYIAVPYCCSCACYSIFESFTIKTCILEVGNLICTITLGTALALQLALFQIYWHLFDSSYLAIKTSLEFNIENKANHSKLINVSLIKKLQYLQAFYIIICENYKHHILSLGNLAYYLTLFLTTISVAILTNIYFYDIVMHPNNIDYFELFDFYLRCALLFWLGFLYFCYFTDELSRSVSIKVIQHCFIQGGLNF